jgi:hypothetical protein
LLLFFIRKNQPKNYSLLHTTTCFAGIRVTSKSVLRG